MEKKSKMNYKKISLVKYLGHRNVVLVLIDDVNYVAKGPEGTEIVVEENILSYNWLISNSIQKKSRLDDFRAEFSMHKSLIDNLNSNLVVVPKGKLVGNEIFLMEFINYESANHKINLNENIENILEALYQTQLVFSENKVQLRRKKIIKHNDFLLFSKNAIKVFYHCKNLKFMYYTVLLMLKFFRLYVIIPKNNQSIFTHGDLRSKSNTDFKINPSIRNFGFQKDSGKIIIFDFASSQTKSKLIYKDIIRIFNYYPRAEFCSEVIEKYVGKLNKSLGYSESTTNNILNASILLVFFAEFSGSINCSRRSEYDIEVFYKALKTRKFNVVFK